ncbi:MAG TPA: complex I NDUFA9 subunit family protein [Methylocystis sp.]|nr:complex I NDUFA9 subunit family protein [Methylocystis sp.]
MDWQTGRLVTVFGGSGFVGRHVVRALARRGWRIRVACRRPDLAFFLQPLGGVGQISCVQANVRDPDSIKAALQGAEAVVNLIGILAESGKQRFSTLQADGPRLIGETARLAGVKRFVHVSAIGADAGSASAYARTKAIGEAGARGEFPGCVILRPSIVFGPEDDFFNRFGTMARFFPVIPLVGGDTKFQPVYVGDVAKAVALAVDGKAEAGATYELGGPEVKTFEQLVRYVLEVVGRDRTVMKLSFGLGALVAGVTSFLSKISLGLFPALLTMTRDQVELLKHDNVVSQEAKEEGRTLQGLGIEPEAVEAIVPSYLWRYRKTGQYQLQRS